MLAEIRRAVDARMSELVGLTQALVRERSLLGNEEGAQRIVDERLHRLGFAVERVQPDAEEARADPLAGLPLLPYEGRTCVAARLPGAGGGRSLHLNGHVDVVPVEAPERWAHDPWGGELADGRIWGRGAGDMKGGIACALVAVEAALALGAPLAGELVVSSVIEEECGGNGMRAVLAAGYTADATLIPEPTDLRLHANGVGVVWARLTARSEAAHAAVASATGRPVDGILDAVGGLRKLEASLNERVEGHPFNLNLGEIHGGVWPSSVPALVVLRCRLGFPPSLSPAEAQRRLRDAVERSAPGVEVEFEGFRAEGYEHDPGSELAVLLRERHTDVLGSAPGLTRSTATTDARFVEGPCLCYGPAAGEIHGTDEWVDVESLRACAVVLALLVRRWCG